MRSKPLVVDTSHFWPIKPMIVVQAPHTTPSRPQVSGALTRLVGSPDLALLLWNAEGDHELRTVHLALPTGLVRITSQETTVAFSKKVSFSGWAWYVEKRETPRPLSNPTVADFQLTGWCMPKFLFCKQLSTRAESSSADY